MLKISKTFLVLIMICFSSTLLAQDIITLRNGEEIKAVVQKVGQTEIEYKKFSNPTGPSYTIAIAEVFMIKYKNGEKDVFPEVAKPQQPQPPQQPQQPPQPQPQQPQIVPSIMTADYSEFRALIDENDDEKTKNWLAKQNDEGIYRTFSTGYKLAKIGRGVRIPGYILSGLGIVVFGCGYIDYAVNRNNISYDSAGYTYDDLSADATAVAVGWGIFGVGSACLATGIPLGIVGKTLKRKSTNAFEDKYFKKTAYQPTLDILYTGNGLGFAINF
ncbi:MAG: hypothetical protein LBN95_10800 [Prevotellaceae bacterium]|jgi:hypothetical protein|nr:hypothetical protein [Prevotellaceae bacterium]